MGKMGPILIAQATPFHSMLGEGLIVMQVREGSRRGQK